MGDEGESCLNNSKGYGEKTAGLLRQLGLFDSTMIMVGIVIGSGIFLTTGIMAKSIPSPGLILLAWVVGGLLTLAGALTFAELGAAMPEAGGQYVYLREAYGPMAGFLFGWILFLVYLTGGIAALAVAFAEYFGYFFPALSIQKEFFSTTVNVFNHSFTYSVSTGQLIGLAAIILLTLFNFFGVAFGKLIQNILTLVKIGTLLAIVVLGFAIGKGTAVRFSLNPSGVNFSQLVIGFGVALVAVSWAFDGWNNINFVAGEIKNPRRNLPLALFLGTLILTVLYVLTNYIYLYALPIEEMTGVVRIAEKATSVMFGGATAAVISAAVMVSAFGSLNGTILAGPRVYYAMAQDKLFFRRVAKVHPRFHTPGFALLIQAVWASILTLSGSFEQLFTFAMFIAIIFWITAAAAVFTLRKKYPELPRPYKTWGYPFVPIIFIVASFGILINTLIEKPVASLAGLGFTALGIPVYYYWKRKKSREDPDIRIQTQS
ncbi:MAG: amino acid permease [Candidatus Aminicenantes bacterium]|nr:amino acid permease [Candidatus Aminicenantes bacterium]